MILNTISNKLRIGLLFKTLLIFIPISILLALFTNYEILTFITVILAIIPLARILGFTTKEISLQTNPTIGGLLSATFGNMIELLISIIALSKGLIRVVQASVIGSIVGNILFLLGLSIFVGGVRFKHQKFNKEAAGVSSTMLIIVIVGLTIPTVYTIVRPDSPHLKTLNAAVAVVMALIYIAGLIFSLKTHKDLFDASDEIKATKEFPKISKSFAALILFFTTIFVAIESEILVRHIEPVVINLGFTQTFIGFIVIAIITNIAETATAVNFAIENKLDISIQIGLSSAIQISLFVIPILLFVSQIFHFGFTLIFSIFEIVSMIFAVMIVNYLSADGRCNWMEGAQLLSVYFIIAIAFFFI
jgi:Ca2+:H+ antiporter